MHGLISPAHVAISAVILLWDILLAGRIAQVRSGPRAFAALAGLAGLLILPGVVLAIASGSIITGRAIYVVAWIWPLVLLVFAAQAVYATMRRLVTPLIGGPIAIYDVTIALAAMTKYWMLRGGSPPAALEALTAAQVNALGFVAGSAALYSPFVLHVPVLSPAYPARYRISPFVRTAFALVAAGWAALMGVQFRAGVLAISSYRRFLDDRLQERPAGDFALGVKLLPDVSGPPSPVAVRSDLALTDTLHFDAVSIVIEPEAATAQPLDSLARMLDPLRRDSTILIVTLAYPANADKSFAASQSGYDRDRLREIEQIARRLRPDYLLPALDPYGRGVRELGRQPVAYWERYLTDAANVAHRIYPRIRVGVSASSYDPMDSTLFAWAASPSSPLNAVGFTLYPSFLGAPQLAARMEAGSRWMQAERAVNAKLKTHWVWAAGGYPAAHGEASQARAVQGVVAWATAIPEIRGVVVASAGDYGAITGLRAPGGRLRPVVGTLARISKAMRETTAR